MYNNILYINIYLKNLLLIIHHYKFLQKENPDIKDTKEMTDAQTVLKEVQVN